MLSTEAPLALDLEPARARTGGDTARFARFDVDPAGQAKPWRIRLAKQAVPFPVAALVWGAATAAHAAADTWPIAPSAATGVYLVAAVVWWASWRHNNPETRASRRRWATTVIGCGGAWLWWAASVGTGHVATVLLAAGGVAAMLPFWTRNSPWQPSRPIRRPAAPVALPEAPTLAVVPVEAAGTPNQIFWDTVIAGPDGVSGMRGTRLVEPHLTDDYEEYVIALVGGKQTTATATGAATNIASAYGRGLDTVQVIPHPSGQQDKAVLRLAKANPLAMIRRYPGPAQAIDLTEGNIRVLYGHRANGSPLWWTFYRAKFGTLGGAVFGDTGSGKSMLLQSLITSAAYTGLIATVVACPQGGASYPMWIKHAHWPAADADEILRQARALAKAHKIRSMVNRLRGREIHVPEPGEPLIIWFVDEIHKMAEHPQGAEFAAISDMIEREGRKTGIRQVASDQDPSVPATFANRMTWRRSLLAAQCYTLRLGSNVSNMLPRMQLNPTTLPQLFPDGSPAAGLGVVLGETEASRVDKLDDPWALAAAAPGIAIEPAVANRMGEDYAARAERALAEDAAVAAELHEYDPELVAELLAENPELAAALPAAQESRLQQAKAAASAAARATDPRPVAPLTVPGVPQLRIVPPTTAEKTTAWTCVDRVHELLRGGVTRFGEIQAQALRPDGRRYSETAIRNALGELIAAGKAAADENRHGHYVAA